MKAGFGFWIWTTHVTEAHLGQLARIKSAGYDGAEVPIFEGMPEHYRWLGGRIADAGLAATAVGVMAGGNPISADAGERRAGIARLEWLSEAPARLRGGGAGRAVPPAARPVQRHRPDRGRAWRWPRRIGPWPTGAGAAAGDRAAETGSNATS